MSAYFHFILTLFYSRWKELTKGDSLTVGILLACGAMALADNLPTDMTFDSIGREFREMSATGLRTLGSGAISHLRADSALAFYTMGASRYDMARTRGEKEDAAVCTINTGYVWLFMLNNPEQAYPWIIRGMEICRDEGFDTYIPIATNYLAQIHALYGDSGKALSLYRQAVRSSAEQEVWWSLLMSYTDLLTFAWEQDSLGAVGNEMRLFESLTVPDMPLSHYAESLHRAMKAYMKQYYPEAERLFRQAASENDAESGREHGDVLNVIFIGEACFRQGNLRAAISILRTAEEMMARYGFHDLSGAIYGRLENYYGALPGKRDSAAYFHLRGLEIRDSIFNAGRYGKIKDLETAAVIIRYDSELRRISADRDSFRRNAWIAAIIAILVAAAVVITVIKNRSLSAANRELYLKNLEILSRDVPAPPVSADLPIAPEPNPEMIRLMGHVREVLDTTPELYDPDFSIDRLAELAGSLPRYISQAISEAGATDFRSLIASYRIREACRRLAEEARDKKLTIETIATEVGYRSRSHFSKVFKEHTGLTPSEFLRQAKK